MKPSERRKLMKYFNTYAGSCIERWKLIENQEIRLKNGIRGIVSIHKNKNRIFLGVKPHSRWSQTQLQGKEGNFFRDFDCVALPIKEIKEWIAIEAMNPDVKARYSLPNLTKSDIQLAGMWCHPIQNNLNGQSIIENYGTDPELGRVLSARSAERVALTFYSSYDKKVNDISITQIEEKPHSEWKIYDLEVDGIPVDVKNSRAYKNGETRYSQYCIPQFKRNRKNHEVTIAGIFSPYLWPREILKPTPYSRDFGVCILGETTRSKLKNLKEEFNSLVESPSTTPEFASFLPPWVFEYPDYVYTERNKALNDFKDFSRITNSTRNPFENCFVPVAIASGTNLAMVLNHDALDQWERTFLEQLVNRIQKFGLSLPFIFLTVLAHFLDMASSGKSDSNFNPDKYRRFLFWEDTNRPLGLYDPLNTIDALIKALGTLWTADSGLIRRFKIFKLISFNILQGKFDQIDSLCTTLIAYCGECGKNPLVLGESELCDYRRLICPEPKCRYCCESCKSVIDG